MTRLSLAKSGFDGFGLDAGRGLSAQVDFLPMIVRQYLPEIDITAQNQSLERNQRSEIKVLEPNFRTAKTRLCQSHLMVD